jgi:hypothetical protein
VPDPCSRYSDAKETRNDHLVLIQEKQFAVCFTEMSTKFPAEITNASVLGSASSDTAHIDKLMKCTHSVTNPTRCAGRETRYSFFYTPFYETFFISVNIQ